jgi:hypothetical protein
MPQALFFYHGRLRAAAFAAGAVVADCFEFALN